MKKKWIWILVILYILFIFSNSLQNGNSSGNLSAEITHYVMKLIQSRNIIIPFDLLHHFIRKLAHFSEYWILGVLTVIALHHKPLFHPSFLNFILFLIAPPCMDEGIQHFVPGRYGCFSDVCIDMSGFLCGALFLYIILCIIEDIHHRRTA